MEYVGVYLGYFGVVGAAIISAAAHNWLLMTWQIITLVWIFGYHTVKMRLDERT